MLEKYKPHGKFICGKIFVYFVMPRDWKHFIVNYLFLCLRQTYKKLFLKLLLGAVFFSQHSMLVQISTDELGILKQILRWREKQC